MISAVAFCPQAPVMVPQLAGSASPELDELRAACRTAIRRLVAPGRQLVVFGGGDRETFHGATTRGSFAGFGLDLEVALGSDEPGPVDLPPSLTVGACLLRDALGAECGATGHAVTDGGALAGLDGDVGLLVVGDGSARRGVKAPGYLDARAADFDDVVATALATGDADRLAGLDPVLGAQLLAAGVPAWRQTGALVRATPWQAELLHRSDPYGVSYLVASWTTRA